MDNSDVQTYSTWDVEYRSGKNVITLKKGNDPERMVSEVKPESKGCYPQFR